MRVLSASLLVLLLGCAPVQEDERVPGPGVANPGGDAISGFGLGSKKPEGAIQALELTDADTGARFDALGRSLDGGPRLTPLPGYNQFWFAWSVFNHDSEVFRRESPVATAAIASNATCAVPCEEINLGCPGKDCIPALTSPKHVAPGQDGSDYVASNSFVVGVEVDGIARAYPHNVLWWHEIVNDQVNGVPIAVTHCPLTFSSIGHDPTAFASGTAELGVSGRLYNSNLVFYDRNDDTWYSQLLGSGTKGPGLGQGAPRVHVWEMTWAAWKAMHPESTLLSSSTGHARNYERYPYGSYFVDDGDTFRPTEPAPDPAYPGKALTYGLRIGSHAKAWVHRELTAWVQENEGEDAPVVGVINDQVGDTKVAIVFDIDAGYVQAFDRTGAADLKRAR